MSLRFLPLHDVFRGSGLTVCALTIAIAETSAHLPRRGGDGLRLRERDGAAGSPVEPERRALLPDAHLEQGIGAVARSDVVVSRAVMYLVQIGRAHV